MFRRVRVGGDLLALHQTPRRHRIPRRPPKFVFVGDGTWLIRELVSTSAEQTDSSGICRITQSSALRERWRMPKEINQIQQIARRFRFCSQCSTLSIRHAFAE